MQVLHFTFILLISKYKKVIEIYFSVKTLEVPEVNTRGRMGNGSLKEEWFDQRLRDPPFENWQMR